MTGLSFTPPQLVLLLLAHPHCISCIRLSLVILFKSIFWLRLYVMKYSNLETMNASSIAKVEHRGK
jgi:hypothetical protein